MNIAKSIRDFFDTLFPNHLMLQMRADLLDALRRLEQEKLDGAAAVVRAIDDGEDTLERTYRQHAELVDGLRTGYEAVIVQIRSELDHANAFNSGQIDSLNSELALQRQRSESDLEEARRERDYFRNRCERLELRILPDPLVRKVRTGQSHEVITGRPNWAKVQADHVKKQREEAAAVNKEPRIDAPKPFVEANAVGEAEDAEGPIEEGPETT